VSRTEPELIHVSKRDLAELFAAVLEFRQATDKASRVRIDAAAACSKIEAILRRVAPGLVLEVAMAHEVTPVEVPKPTR